MSTNISLDSLEPGETYSFIIKGPFDYTDKFENSINIEYPEIKCEGIFLKKSESGLYFFRNIIMSNNENTNKNSTVYYVNKSIFTKMDIISISKDNSFDNIKENPQDGMELRSMGPSKYGGKSSKSKQRRHKKTTQRRKKKSTRRHKN